MLQDAEQYAQLLTPEREEAKLQSKVKGMVDKELSSKRHVHFVDDEDDAPKPAREGQPSDLLARMKAANLQHLFQPSRTLKSAAKA